MNVSHSVVNALVNAGMSKDSLLLVEDEDSHWFHEVKGSG